MKFFEKVKKLGNKYKIPDSLYFKKWANPDAQS